MACEIDAAALYERSGHIKKMLRPLVSPQAVLAVEIPERNPFMTMAVLSGRKVLNHYRDWRFNTYVDGIRAGYYERWGPIDASRRRYYFERAYLHLFHRTGTLRDAAESQILALHCDPNEPLTAPHARYKLGPHVHVSAAASPLDESHIALNYSHLDAVLSSFESLCKAWDNSITLVKEEILSLYT